MTHQNKDKRALFKTTELEKVVYFASTLVRKDFENRDLVRKFSMRKEKIKNGKKKKKRENRKKFLLSLVILIG